MNWTDAATATMTETLMRCRSDGATPEATAKAIDAAYPFGERARWPYKAWLAARKAFFAKHGLPRSGDRKSDKERLDDLVARMGAKKHWSGPQVGAGDTATEGHNAELRGRPLADGPA